MTICLPGHGLSWLTVIPLALTAYPALGQTAAGGARSTDASVSTLQEVVVTAEKRTESLQSVPVPETVVSADALSASGQPRLQDYYARVPGLSLNNLGAGQTSIAIRGITTGGQTNPTVGITIDDVPYGSDSILGYASLLVPDIDPADLERVEILKGPQGTLYGASSMGGLLKFDTVAPSTAAVSGHVEGDLSNVDHADGVVGYTGRGSINVPLSSTFAVLASAFTRRDPGYVDNVATGQRGVNQIDTNGGRLAALFEPGEDLSLELGAFVQNTKGYGTPAVTTNYLLQPALGDLTQSRTPGTEEYNNSARLFTARLRADLGAFDLTSVSGYGSYGYTGIQDAAATYGDSLAAPFYGVSGAGISNDFLTRRFTQELRLSSHRGQTLEWLGGVFYSHEDTFAEQKLLAIDPSTSFPVGAPLDSVFPLKITEYAAFGNLDVHVTRQFDVQFGAREQSDRQVYNETDSGVLVPFAFGLPSPLIAPTLRSDDHAFTYLVTPRLKLTPDLMVYVRVASGFRAGGPNPDAKLFGLPSTYNPDKTVNYELGAKGDLLHHLLSFDASIYYIDWKNIQLQLVDPVSGFAYFTNGSGARSKGAELTVQTWPVGGFTVSATASYTDARLTAGLPPSSTAVANAGDRLPYSARFTGSVSAEEDAAVSDSATGFAAASLSYVGDRYGSFAGAADWIRVHMPGYAELDLRTGVRQNNWTINLFVDNVSDRRGLVGAGGISTVSQTQSDPFYVTYIRPRTVGLSVSKAF